MENNTAGQNDEQVKAKKGKTPFNELTKKDKILRIVAFCLAGAVFASCLAAGIYFLIVGDPDNRIMPSLGVAFLAVAPLLIELIFRIRLSSFMLIFLYIFMFFAGFLGCSMNWYNIYGVYDNVMHGTFGYVGAAIGLFLMVKTKNYKGLNVAGAAFFIFAFSMACGAIWEIIEFTADNLMGANGQGWQIVNGIFVDGPMKGQSAGIVRDVSDTMSDVIMNFIGAIVFCIHFLLHRFTKKDLLLGTAIENFASN